MALAEDAAFKQLERMLMRDHGKLLWRPTLCGSYRRHTNGVRKRDC